MMSKEIRRFMVRIISDVPSVGQPRKASPSSQRETRWCGFGHAFVRPLADLRCSLVLTMKTFNEWLNEGEQLYSLAVDEFKAIEAQINDLELQLTAKKSEVNQIAQIIGKPVVENARRVTAEVVEASQMPISSVGAAIPIGRLARALTGRG